MRALFESAPELSSGIGNLVFTGDVDDPDTLKTLSQLGFERPSDISRDDPRPGISAATARRSRPRRASG